jgi:hypothetical protein
MKRETLLPNFNRDDATLLQACCPAIHPTKWYAIKQLEGTG